MKGWFDWWNGTQYPPGDQIDRYDAPLHKIPIFVLAGTVEFTNMIEMVQLLETQRNFESTQRAVRSIDDALKKATNEVGKYR